MLIFLIYHIQLSWQVSALRIGYFREPPRRVMTKPSPIVVARPNIELEIMILDFHV